MLLPILSVMLSTANKLQPYFRKWCRCYIKKNGIKLFWVITQRVVANPYRRFGTIEKSVKIYQYSLRKKIQACDEVFSSTASFIQCIQ
jgi:hypothetical protein